MTSPQAKRILDLARAQGVIRTRDVDELGIPRAVLGRLVRRGSIVREARGLYRHPGTELSTHHSLVEVAHRVPGAVVNLISALSYHELTDELPHAVWIAIQRGSQRPRLDRPIIEVTWTEPRFLSTGVTRHRIEGIDVPVTDPARTVADCFKFRSRVGVDIAIAALRDYLRTFRGGRDALWEMAGFCRVRTVIRPYLETMS